MKLAITATPSEARFVPILVRSSANDAFSLAAKLGFEGVELHLRHSDDVDRDEVSFLIRTTGLANVGLNFDACHFYGGGGELSEIGQLDPRWIWTFHINDMETIPKEAITDNRRLLPGEGVVPLARICEAIQDIGYDRLAVRGGTVSPAVLGPRDPYELAITSHRAAERVLSPYFNLE